MPIYALGSQEPSIADSAYIHPQAVVIGSVTIGPRSSVWPCAVLRGDDGEIRVGEETSIQDGAVIHTTLELPTTVGDRCVIGHLAHLEGCRIGNEALVGSSSVVLHDAQIGDGALVGANAMVVGGTVVPDGAMALGVPAVIKLDRSNREHILQGARSYVARAERFTAELRRID